MLNIKWKYIKRYEDDLKILATNIPADIYRHLDVSLKHISKDALKPFYIVKKAIQTGNRRPNNEVNSRSDKILTDITAIFPNVINGENTSWIPVRFLFDIGLINHLIKLHTKLICILETNTFKSNVNLLNVAAPNPNIIWYDTPFLQYEQFRLIDMLRLRLETIFFLKYFFIRCEETTLKIVQISCRVTMLRGPFCSSKSTFWLVRKIFTLQQKW